MRHPYTDEDVEELERLRLLALKRTAGQPDERRPARGLFIPVIGADYEKHRGVMLVGKATEGPVDDTIGMRTVTEMHAALLKTDPPDSPFWTLAYTLHERLGGGPPCKSGLPPSLVWSNLLKIGQQEGAASGEVAKVQLDFCKELFKRELKELKPRIVVMVHATAQPYRKLAEEVVFRGGPATWTEGEHRFAAGPSKGKSICDHFYDEQAERHYFWAYHPQWKAQPEYTNAVLACIERYARSP